MLNDLDRRLHDVPEAGARRVGYASAYQERKFFAGNSSIFTKLHAIQERKEEQNNGVASSGLGCEVCRWSSRFEPCTSIRLHG